MNSLYSNTFCSFFKEKSTYLVIAKNYVFRVLLEIMKSGLKYIVAVTTSYFKATTTNVLYKKALSVLQYFEGHLGQCTL